MISHLNSNNENEFSVAKNFGDKNFGAKNVGNKNFGSKNFGDKNFGDKNFGDKNFGDRINYILQHQRRSKTWLAQQLEISKQSLNYLCKRSKRHDYAGEISSILNVNARWLTSGNGPIFNETVGEREDTNYRMLPIFTLEELKTQRIDTKSPRPQIVCEIDIPAHAFAFEIDENICCQPFMPKQIVIALPRHQPECNDYVLFNQQKCQHIGIIKFSNLNQYIIDCEAKNKSTPEGGPAIEDNINILGTCVEIRQRVIRSKIISG